MQLALSVRIAEAPCKTKLNIPFRDLLQLAVDNGYRSVCMRASAGGVQTPRDDLLRMRDDLDRAGLTVSMVTADFDVPLNNERGPNALRDMDPSLDVAETLGCDLIRVCLKTDDDIPHAQRAADLAADRGIRLAHQCHTASLFEQVDHSVDVLQRIDRPNFGIIYEPANLLLCDEDYGIETLRKFRPYLMNVYVQNHVLDPDGPSELETWCRGRRRYRPLPIWESGGVDFSEVFDGLREIGYDGPVTVHQAFAELMGPEEAARRSAEFLRTLDGLGK